MIDPTHKTADYSFWLTYSDAASRFAYEWAFEIDERQEFIHIFNIKRKQFARHEALAKCNDNWRGFTDNAKLISLSMQTGWMHISKNLTTHS